MTENKDLFEEGQPAESAKKKRGRPPKQLKNDDCKLTIDKKETNEDDWEKQDQVQKLLVPDYIFMMKLLEKVRYEDDTVIIRVPGGWIFQLVDNFEGQVITNAVFVPMSSS